MANPFQVLTLNKISSSGLRRLPAERYAVGNDKSQPDAIFVRSQNMLEMVITKSRFGGGGPGVF